MDSTSDSRSPVRGDGRKQLSLGPPAASGVTSAPPGSSHGGFSSSISNISLRDRVKALPQVTVQRILTNALTKPDEVHTPRGRKGWGFSKVTREDLNSPGEFMTVLRGDRWYHCPDSMDGMSEAFGVAAQVECLRGSTAYELPTESQKKGIESLHSELRRESKVAWAQEAVVMGVGRAKQQEHDKAIGCYDRALELQPDNVDAMVAKGAALANLSRFREAVACFQKALDVNPDHVNAKHYLHATREKVTSGSQPSSAAQRQAQRSRTPGHTRQSHEPSSSEAKGFNLQEELDKAFASVKRKMARKDRKSAGDEREKKLRREKKHKRKQSKSHRKSKRRRRSRSPGSTDSGSGSSPATA